MAASSDRGDGQNRVWWKLLAFLSVAVVLTVFLASLGTDTESSNSPLRPDEDTSVPISAPEDDRAARTDEEDGPAPTESSAKLDSGWYWSVSYGSGPSSLWISSPESERRIGQTVDEESNGIQLNDLAISPNGDLYAISLTHLYQVDAAGQLGDTVPMRKVGPLVGTGSANGLVFLANGRLIAAGRHGLSEIDVETGVATSVLSFDSRYQSSGDLIEVSDSTLLLTVSSGPASDALAEIRLDTNDFRILIDDLPAATYGLVGTADKLFGLHVATENEAECRAGGVLIEINMESKSTETIRCLDFTPAGSAHSD